MLGERPPRWHRYSPSCRLEAVELVRLDDEVGQGQRGATTAFSGSTPMRRTSSCFDPKPAHALTRRYDVAVLAGSFQCEHHIVPLPLVLQQRHGRARRRFLIRLRISAASGEIIPSLSKQRLHCVDPQESRLSCACLGQAGDRRQQRPAALPLCRADNGVGVPQRRSPGAPAPASPGDQIVAQQRLMIAFDVVVGDHQPLFGP